MSAWRRQGGAAGGASQPQRENQPRTADRQPFDIDKALNTPGFAEFLGQFADAETVPLDEANAAELGQRFEVFQKKNEAVREVQRLYRDEIQRETGVALDDADLRVVEEYFSREATGRTPEVVTSLLEEAKEAVRLRGSIGEKERQLKALGGREALAGRQADLALAQRGLRRSALSRLVTTATKSGRAALQAEAEAEGRVGTDHKVRLENLDRELEKTTGKLKTRDEAEIAHQEMGHKFQEVRDRFFEENFEPAQKIAEIARQKAQQRLQDMAGQAQTLAERDAARQLYGRMAGEGGPAAVDYLEGMPAGFLETLDRQVEEKVGEAIADAVDTTDVATSRALAELERKLKPLLTREEVGSRRGDEARGHVRQVLLDKQDGLTEPAKKLLLGRIIVKFDQGKL